VNGEALDVMVQVGPSEKPVVTPMQRHKHCAGGEGLRDKK